jgi:hypothetical protein
MLRPLLALSIAALGPVSLGPVVPGKGGAEARELRYTDSAGQHVVRFELSAITTKTIDDLEQKTRTLRVSDRVGGKALWSAKDFIEPCPFDLLFELAKDSIEVTDLDDDGVAEVSFAYLLACRSDVSPANAKLLLYEGQAKYALRGTARDMGGGGTFTVDPALVKGPPAFRAYAEAKWRKHLVDAFPPVPAE